MKKISRHDGKCLQFQHLAGRDRKMEAKGQPGVGSNILSGKTTIEK